MATGKVKKYQFLVGVITLFTLPISYILLKLGYPPETSIIVLITVYIFAYIPRLIIVRNQLNISIKDYFVQVINKTTIVSLISIIVPLILVYKMDTGFLRLAITIIVSLLSVLISVFVFGINQAERIFAINFTKKKLYGIFRN